MVVNSDTLDEIDENFTVHLADPNNATIADGIGLGTITDDDALPGLSVNDVTVTEGDAGTVNAVFTVTLAPVSGQTVSVDWATANGTRGLARRLHGRPAASFPSPRARPPSTVAVTVNADLLDEANETFLVNLLGPDECDDRRRSGHRHDHRQRPAADARDRRRDGDRARLRDRRRTFTVSLSAPSGRDGQRHLRHCERVGFEPE